MRTPLYKAHQTVEVSYNPTFHPDGSRLAFIRQKRGGRPQVWEANLRDGSLVQLTRWKRSVADMAYAPDGSGLLLVAAGVNEDPQLSFLRSGSNKIEALTRTRDVTHYFGGWAPGGTLFAYSADLDRVGRTDLYVYDCATGTSTLLLQGEQHAFGLSWTDDGSQVIALQLQAASSRLVLVDRTTAAIQELGSEDSEASFGRPVLTPDRKALYVLSDMTQEYDSIWRFEFSSGSWTAVIEHSWDVEDFALNAQANLLAYSLNVDGASELRVLDLVSKQELALDTLPPGMAGQLTWSPNHKRLAFTLDSALHPPGVWTWDVAAQLARPVVASSWKKTHVPPPELVHIPSFDGVTISAWLYRPTKTTWRIPYVIYLHGGPQMQARPNYNRTIQFLVQSGYGVLAPNFRGSTGYGRAFTKLDDGRLREDVLADVKACRDWVVHSGGDPGRIALWGISYGAFLSLAMATRFPDLWAACVEISGMCDLETFLSSLGQERWAARELEYGSLEENREWFRQISPLHNAERLTVPLLMVHGTEDELVPIAQADALAERLQLLGRPPQFLRLQNGGHGLTSAGHRSAVHEEAAKFLRWSLR